VKLRGAYWRFLLQAGLLLLALQSCKAASLDLVLVLEDSFGMSPYLRNTSLTGLQGDDHVALVFFSNEAKVRIPLTADTGRVLAAARRTRRPNSAGRADVLWRPTRGPEKKVRVWDALAVAAEVFQGRPDPSRRRVIVLLLGDEERGSKTRYDAVKAALRQANATLFASVVGAYAQSNVSMTSRRVMTPPTFPGAYGNVKPGPAPDAMLKLIAA